LICVAGLALVRRVARQPPPNTQGFNKAANGWYFARAEYNLAQLSPAIAIYLGL
jgi:hypothetical protein